MNKMQCEKIFLFKSFRKLLQKLSFFNLHHSLNFSALSKSNQLSFRASSEVTTGKLW